MPAAIRPLDHDNWRFVGALLRCHLECDRIPHGWSIEHFRSALIEHGIIARAGEQSVLRPSPTGGSTW